jgi:uncharacterized repeat protein (TIGR01451 family)
MTCDPSGNGEGQTFLGAAVAVTNSACNATINVTLPLSVPAGQLITATASVKGGDGVSSDTSEFSRCVQVTAGAQDADLVITKTVAPAPPSTQVAPGSDIIYTISLSNNGPGTASNVTVTDNLPPQTTYQSSTPAGGGTGNNRTFTFASLAPGSASALTITIRARVNNNVTECSITNTATVVASSSDPDTANNTARATITLAASGAINLVGGSSLDFTPAILPNQSSTRDITLENTAACARDVTFTSVLRTGSDVTSGRISDPSDSTFFRVARADGSAVNFGTPVQLATGQARFLVTFAPVVPARAGNNTGLRANQVLPDMFTSALNITPAGGSAISVNMTGRVSKTIRIISGLSFSKSADRFTISFDVYAPVPSDVESVTYEFLDGSGTAAEPPHTESLAAAIARANLVRGQSFGVEQTGSGMNEHPDIVRVRVTVSGAGLSATATSNRAAGVSDAPTIRLVPPEERRTLVFSHAEIRPGSGRAASSR